jgi:hypothetical protein
VIIGEERDNEEEVLGSERGWMRCWHMILNCGIGVRWVLGVWKEGEREWKRSERRANLLTDASVAHMEEIFEGIFR